MKHLFKASLLGALLFLAVPAKAEVAIFQLTNGLPTLLSSTPIIVDNISLFASSGTNMTVRFYDVSTAVTNLARAAYTRYTTYSTNFSNVFTNESGLLVTNTFVGVYTAPVAVDAVTNELNVVYSIQAPANALVSKDTEILTMRGLAAYAVASGQLILTFRRPVN